jgi:SMC interacting uncharacterized protein involved in chromosome segregation
MWNWLLKLYLLIRGDRFARDKLEEIREEIHKNAIEINSRLVRIESELQNHINATNANYELLEQKINSSVLTNELVLKMLDDRFDALNLKIDLLKR